MFLEFLYLITQPILTPLWIGLGGVVAYDVGRRLYTFSQAIKNQDNQYRKAHQKLCTKIEMLHSETEEKRAQYKLLLKQNREMEKMQFFVEEKLQNLNDRLWESRKHLPNEHKLLDSFNAYSVFHETHLKKSTAEQDGGDSGEGGVGLAYEKPYEEIEEEFFQKYLIEIEKEEKTELEGAEESEETEASEKSEKPEEGESFEGNEEPEEDEVSEESEELEENEATEESEELEENEVSEESEELEENEASDESEEPEENEASEESEEPEENETSEESEESEEKEASEESEEPEEEETSEEREESEKGEEPKEKEESGSDEVAEEEEQQHTHTHAHNEHVEHSRENHQEHTESHDILHAPIPGGFKKTVNLNFWGIRYGALGLASACALQAVDPLAAQPLFVFLTTAAAVGASTYGTVKTVKPKVATLAHHAGKVKRLETIALSLTKETQALESHIEIQQQQHDALEKNLHALLKNEDVNSEHVVARLNHQVKEEHIQDYKPTQLPRLDEDSSSVPELTM